MIGRSTVSRWFLALGGVLVFVAPFTERASAQRPVRHPAGAMVLEASGAGRVKKLTDQDDRRLVSVIVELDESSLAARPGAQAIAARGAKNASRTSTPNPEPADAGRAKPAVLPS